LVSENFNKWGVGVRRTEVIVGDVHRPEEGVVGHHRVKKTVERGVGSDSLGHRDVDGY
jgi:hypothetical protein